MSKALTKLDFQDKKHSFENADFVKDTSNRPRTSTTLETQIKQNHSSIMEHAWKQIKQFGTGSTLLYQNYQTFKYINDCIETSQNYQNAWTTVTSVDKTKTQSQIPRWASEYQRQFVRDVSIVAPTAICFAIPIVGYIAPILSIPFARQMLSTHFMISKHQQLTLIEVEMIERIKCDEPLIYHLIDYLSSLTTKTSTNTATSETNNELQQQFKETSTELTIEQRRTKANTLIHRLATTIAAEQNTNQLCQIKSLSKSYLITLLQSCACTKLPNQVSQYVYRFCVPKSVLCWFIRQRGQDILQDDIDLLCEVVTHDEKMTRRQRRQRQDTTGTDKLSWETIKQYIDTRISDQDIQKACVLRGLWPHNGVSSSKEHLQMMLSDHLFLMNQILPLLQQDQQINDVNNNDVMILMALHLTPLRRYLQL